MTSCTFNKQDTTIEFRSSSIFQPEWVLQLSGAEVSNDEGAAMAQAISVLAETGRTPSQLAVDLAASQAEVARLRGALESARSYGAESWATWLISEVDDALDSALATKGSK